MEVDQENNPGNEFDELYNVNVLNKPLKAIEVIKKILIIFDRINGSWCLRF
jgi:hypothetical protein